MAPETAGQSARRRVAIVPHTHWDREWYASFQTFRMRLVDLLDDLLPRLDGDPAFAHFMLDGQLAVVDDYLAVRPGAEAALRRLVAAGRLSIGPWYALPDEFLVSGETLVRNLQLGLARAAAFGGAMEVGYLPDMFGHVAQMPQLLRQFGFEHAVVWRGVPSAVERSAFWWTALDGSIVRAEYLPQGYGNGASVPDDAKRLVARIAEFADGYRDRLVGPILWMTGTDHQVPQPWLGRVVAEANDAQDDYGLEISSLPAYLRSAPVDGLGEWSGELRSGAHANLLMGVASNRVDVKQDAARAERELEQRAEPLSALFLPPAQWPRELLDTAWLEVVRNSAHDSICACSIDEVVDAVRHRFAEATRIAEGLTDRALGALAGSVDANGPVVVNPSARTRGGLVELEVPGTGVVKGTQVLAEREADVVLGTFGSSALAAGLVAELDYVPRYRKASIETEGGEVVFAAERRGGRAGRLISPAERVELLALLGDTTPRRLRVRATQEPSQRLLARVDAVPGYGWRSWSPATAKTESAVTVGESGRSLANGLVTVVADDDGTIAVDGLRGLARLVDDGDVGDTYNWCPPASDFVVDRPSSVSVAVGESGPLRGRLDIAATYQWPERANIADGGSRIDAGLVDVTVHTAVELHAGEGLVRIAHRFDNRARDHRLRAWFPLPETADSSRAECAFAVVDRGLVAEGGPTERALPTFPSRRFVQAGGLTLVHEGLLEYELVDIVDGRAGALALTLLRATGLLSQGPMVTRPLPAGPVIRAEGAQLQGSVVVRYGLVVANDVDAYAAVDEAFLPLLVTGPDAGRTGPGRQPSVTRAPAGQALAISGAEISALRRTPGGRLEVRVFNPSAEPTVVRVEGRAGWLVDLRGRPVEPFETSFDLGPWRIATAVLDDDSAGEP